MVRLETKPHEFHSLLTGAFTGGAMTIVMVTDFGESLSILQTILLAAAVGVVAGLISLYIGKSVAKSH